MDRQELFAKRLGGWRRSQALSQREVAARIGVTEQTIYNWEAGQSVPSFAGLRRLVEVSAITGDWWLGIEHAPSRRTP